MRRLSTSIFAALCVCLSATARATETSASVLMPSFALGTMPLAVSNTPSDLIVPVRITTAEMWRLSLERQTDPDSQTAPDPWEVNIDGEWTPMQSGVPVTIRTGQPTATDGVVAQVQLRFTPSFAMAPGARRYRFNFRLNGRRVDPPVQVDCTIPATAVADDDHSAFSIVAERPTDRYVYDFNPRTIVVRSNSRWVLEVSVKTAGRATSDESYVLEALDASGTYRPITAPVTVQTGQPTGPDGMASVVRLRLKLANRNVAGTYADGIIVTARTVVTE